MSLLIVLIILLLIFGGGGLSYRSWGSSGPAWGGNVLWLLFAVVLIVLALNVLGVALPRY